MLRKIKPILLFTKSLWAHNWNIVNILFVLVIIRLILMMQTQSQIGRWLAGRVHIIGPPSHWSPISLVPHLIGPPPHWSPISLIPQLAPMHHSFHWSPISLVPPTHWSPISLVPHLIGPLLIGPPIHKSPTTLFALIGPPSHWSPFSLVHPFSANPNGPTSHWSPISLVPHLIGPPISTHAPPIPLVPIPLVPSHRLVLQFISPRRIVWTLWPHYHWSPLVTLSTLFSLVPHLIGPTM